MVGREFEIEFNHSKFSTYDQEQLRRYIAFAKQHPVVGTIFSKGLSAIRDEILARDPNALPGATSNHCYFCWYVLTRGLAAGVNGGGGKVGDWTGDRANFSGKLIQLGVRMP